MQLLEDWFGATHSYWVSSRGLICLRSLARYDTIRGAGKWSSFMRLVTGGAVIRSRKNS